MLRSRAVLAGHAAYPELCPDWIEQQILRAYIQLAVGPDNLETYRTVTVIRLGSVDVSLTEDREAAVAGLPPFSLELRSRTGGADISSIGCREFDEDELTAAVAFVLEATHRLRSVH
ncbi:hypothetical protein [Microvirga sesbaniae]|uniref:hypothetical protein n=1 Tax=Microvirga sesbaniae TaxID=681392 RepID=UPI0021C67019|nr:hypothetical protein [Microvirga sp. HBU67692]